VVLSLHLQMPAYLLCGTSALLLKSLADSGRAVKILTKVGLSDTIRVLDKDGMVYDMLAAPKPGTQYVIPTFLKNSVWTSIGLIVHLKDIRLSF